MKRDLQIRDLENFVVLAEQGSVTRAAEKVGISQPAMSVALRRLEKTVGSQLFVRHRGQGIDLTPEGRLLVAEARSVLERVDGLETTMSSAGSDHGGSVELGSLVTLAPIVVPPLMRRFREANAGVGVELHSGSQDQLLDWLNSGRIHLALTYDIEITADVDFERVADAVPHALLPAHHRLADRESVALSELSDDPYILIDLPLSKDYFSSLFRAAELTAQPTHRHGDLSLVRSLVGNGFGYSLVNLLPASDVALDGSEVVYVPLQTSLRPIGVGLATRRADSPPQSVKLFIDFVRQSLILPR